MSIQSRADVESRMKSNTNDLQLELTKKQSVAVC